jgi:hypothetical protein
MLMLSHAAQGFVRVAHPRMRPRGRQCEFTGPALLLRGLSSYIADPWKVLGVKRGASMDEVIVGA